MTEKLKFRISTELKTLIGKELITDDYIAIFELVKNSYDANAKKVKIIFQNIKDSEDGKKGRIFVQDDGEGMSHDDIEKKWLFVGYSEKRKSEEELKGKDYRDHIGKRRIFAGAKGIGRFSCDKLGKELKIYTRRINERNIHVLSVDWEEFEKQPLSEFQTIEVDYEEHRSLNIDVSIAGFTHGTILEISSLRSSWDRPKLRDLKRHLQRLINPMQIGQQEFKIEMEAKEYLDDDRKYRSKGEHEIVNGPITNVVLEKLNLKTTNITCAVDSEGQRIHTELLDKGKFIFTLEEKNEYPLLRDIVIKLFYLNPSAKITFNKRMGLKPVQYGSVFFYKNGIKINPYGNFGDDWLGLNRRKTQGMRRFFGTREVLGRIEVNGYQPQFIEVSSRDGGVVKTPELAQLKNLFFEKAIRRLERYVVEGLAWESDELPKDPEAVRTDTLRVISRIVGHNPDSETKISFSKNLLQIYEEKQIEKAPEIIRNLKALRQFMPSKDDKDYLDDQTASLGTAFKKLQAQRKELERELELTESQNIFLRQITDEEKEDIIRLQHHIKISTGTMVGHLMGLKEDAEKMKKISKETLLPIIDDILLQLSLIQSIVMYVTKASYDVKVAKITKDVVQFVKQYVENVYSPRYSSAQKMSIKVVTEKSLAFINKFRPLDLVMIIDNLIDNASKAEARNVDIMINKLDENGIEIRVKDDGKGIHKDYLKKIFELGFSTTGGSGIGLYNIKKIVAENGWQIRANEKVEKGAEFILEMRK